ncbi:flagellar protein FlaG [Mesobacillus subterraneus]|uniref:flagellar protein FlaG n=1 Tax=Mesobacillus subterraneus TaxID=285983 RepID=UPI001CFD7125|nr:flagellar protein FlaG [Mesobacillus subterraneus]
MINRLSFDTTKVFSSRGEDGIKTESTDQINGENAFPRTKEENQQENIFPKEKARDLVSGMNKLLEPVQTSLKFKYHEKLDEYYVTLIDDETQEVLRELPPKKLLDIYAAMTEFLGIIVDRKI